jgi:hypothetical protein
METLQRTANRGSISTGYDIDNSLKMEADNSEYLEKTNDAGTNRKTFTVSMWFKRTELANDYMQLWQGGQFGEATRLGFYGGTPKEAIWVDIGGGTGNSATLSRSYSTQVLRDTSAWYHIVLAVDTTQATEADRFRLWLNGSEVTDWSQRQYPAQDFQCALEASINMRWGAYDATYYKMSGYIAECHYLDGVTAVQTDFGEYDEDSGIWKPKAYAGSYGGNGCYLNFDDSASLGADSSGNGNNFTLNNITSADQATDTPTNNFSNLEVGRNPAATFLTFNEGNTKLTYAGSTTAYDSDGSGISNFRVNTSGKWYMEFSFAGDGDRAVVGVVSDQGANHAADTDYTRYIMYRGNDGAVIYNTNGSDVTVSGAGPTYDSPDVIGIALDCDNERVSFSKNGNWIDGSGAGASNSSPTYYVDWTGHDFLTNSTGNGNCVFVCTNYVNGGTPVIESNFGGYTTNSISSGNSDANGYGNFEYAPPTGYYALCTKNLAEYG